MLDSLIALDKVWFLVINNSLANPFFDFLLPHIRNAVNWVPLYLTVLFFLVKHFKYRAFLIILLLGITVIATDQLSSTLVKKSVERLRPCNDPTFKEEVRLLIHCGSGYSFTSSHATNHFGIAVMLFFFFPYKKLRYWWFVWAGLIGFSQIYVGVHYPLDVFFGSLLGILTSLGTLFIFTRFKSFHSLLRGI